MADVRVAVADDDGAILDVLRLLFDVPGFDLVGTASEGTAVPALVRDTRPDVLVLDLDLPGIDGRSLTPHVRAANDLTRIVLYSAKDVSHDDGIDADAIVPKLAPTHELLDAVSQLAPRSSPAE